MFHNTKYLSSYFEASKPFVILLGKVFAVQVEYNMFLTPLPHFTFLVSP